MISRQETILKLVVEEYIRSAEPVASLHIVSQFDLDVSPATVRNDMCVLEEAGYLTQPHTSAGRVPTELGYRYYLANFLHLAPVASARRRLESVMAESSSTENTLRRVARTLGDLSGETAVMATEQGGSYYAGMANLFGKPDFSDAQILAELARVFDEMEGILHALFGTITDEPIVLIGTKNPFGSSFSSVFIRYRASPQMSGIIGLIGPMRMDYNRNVGLVQLAHELLNQPSPSYER
ncbi:DeoR family transcriptional regulator [Candidatus Uhrbacteria bacterium]|nr:DeoR family transcriptional regulator [Candidatus Uhrbacteria bacterium]